ncbi:MAG TPA: SRPBCC family protein [Hanamia sp.]|nr:SRPBCC family protein [Hanamia sp.]
MKNVLNFLFFIITVFVIIFLVSLLLPSKVTVTKSVEINATPERVRDQIINFENWKNWYPAFTDENITIIKNPPSQNILNSVTLKDRQGKNVTLNLVDSSRNIITINLPSSSSAKVSYQFFLIPKKNNQVQLTWNINTDLGWYPWRRIRGIFLDKFSGPQYEAALENLRKAIEN